MPEKLIVMSGIPGTGKSAVAEALATALRAPVYAKDWLEAALLESGAVGRDRLGRVGYSLLTTLARRQLELGQSAILDSVAGLDSIRQPWLQLSREFKASLSVIECVCSDPGLHRQRLNERRRGISGWAELEWSEVERVKGYFAPWSTERLTLDSAAPLSENIAQVFEYVNRPYEPAG